MRRVVAVAFLLLFLGAGGSEVVAQTGPICQPSRDCLNVRRTRGTFGPRCQVCIQQYCITVTRTCDEIVTVSEPECHDCQWTV